MNAIEFAARLDGREYGDEITKDEAAEAKAAGLVVVFGYSDDNVELRGTIRDEVSAVDGTTLYFNNTGLLTNECEDARCPYHEREKQKAIKIEANWCAVGEDYAWTFKTEIPHAVFHIMDGEEKFCRGIVFNMAFLNGGAA